MATYLFGKCFGKGHRKIAGVPAGLHPVFEDVCQGAEQLDAAALQRFLNKYQGWEDASLEDAAGILATFSGSTGEDQSLTIEGFVELMLGQDLHKPRQLDVVEDDMSEPLPHYFIWSGHNSYLTGDQLVSSSSTKPLEEALKRGVRVLELDVWPTGDKKGVEVLHGMTLTKPVSFESCLQTIAENAFVQSEYPFILALENHLPVELQAEASKLLHSTFGTMLFTSADLEALGSPDFPSPEQLKRRILISSDHENNCLSVEKKDKHEAAGGAPEAASDGIDEGKPKPQAPEWAALLTLKTLKIKGPKEEKVLHAAVSTLNLDEGLNLGEGMFKDLVKGHSDDIVLFTQRHIMRIFPAGLRVDSSNLDPIPLLVNGAQMVAMNQQGYGRPFWQYNGFFRANGGCGYVRKPECLLRPPVPEGAGGGEEGHVGGGKGGATPPHLQREVQTVLTVEVLMGNGWKECSLKSTFDTFSAPDFYIKVGIAGAPADSQLLKTDVVETKSWQPEFKAGTFSFPLTVPELAVFRLEAYDNDTAAKDEFAGQIAMPVKHLVPGYNTFQLLDKKGYPLEPVRVLCHVSFAPEK